jgi:DNA-binding NtrC family response regulator
MVEINVPYPLVAGQTALDSPDAPLARSKYEILIADDEAPLLGVLKIGMQQRGFRVWLAGSGRDAVEIYRRRREAVDMVLLDVRMPGLDGVQTLAAIQAINPHVRCCFMSGDIGDYTEERLLAMGAIAIIPKPFQLAAVAQLLWEKVSQDRRGGRGARPRTLESSSVETGLVNTI